MYILLKVKRCQPAVIKHLLYLSMTPKLGFYVAKSPNCNES